MSSPDPQEAAARQRIITHMNNDHHDSVRRYVEYYSRLSSFAARSARLTDVSTTELSISCGSSMHKIPFSPPLNSLREVRERVVQMDKDALSGLGRHPVTVDKYSPPKPHHWAIITAIVAVMAAFSTPANFKPGSLFYDNVLLNFPAFAAFCVKQQPLVIPVTVILHSYESVIMARKCKSHSVATGSFLWFAWVGTTFVEGLTCLQRFDAFVGEKTKEKEGKRH